MLLLLGKYSEHYSLIFMDPNSTFTNEAKLFVRAENNFSSEPGLLTIKERSKLRSDFCQICSCVKQNGTPQ